MVKYISKTVSAQYLDSLMRTGQTNNKMLFTVVQIDVALISVM